MPNKENARPLLEQEAGQANNISNSDYTTTNTRAQAISNLLPQGEENAITSRELVKLVGCQSVRELQHRVAAERSDGALTLSSCKGGYYRPSDGPEGQREIAAFIQTLRARALNTLVAIKAARKALEGVDGQLDLDGLEGL